MKITEKLNQVTNNVFDFTCKSAVLDSTAGVCFLEFYYNDGTILSSEVKEICAKAVAEFLPEGFEYNIKYIKNFVTENSVKDFLLDYLKNDCPSVVFKIEDVQIGQMTIKLSIAQEQQDYAKRKNIVKLLSEALKERFDLDFLINVNYKEQMIDFSSQEETEVQDFTPKYIVVDNKQVIIGEEISNNATYIRDSKLVNSTVTIAGNIKDITIKYTRPKVKEGEDAEKVYAYFKDPNVPLAERKEAGQKQYYKFKVEDFTGDILCTYFPKKGDNAENFLDISNGDGVIITGEVKEDKFSGLTLKAISLSKCTLPLKWEEEIDYKSEKPFYQYVKPQELTYTNQVGLFSMFDTPKVAPFLKDNNIVVFDFETTGLNPYSGDKIVEIGAVKVINGVITQSFRTLVNPQMHIPEDSSKVHGIFDADVQDAPKAEQALQDFYKFTRGCVLVGYNVSFDYGFLIKQGKECKYNFQAKTFDVLELARQSIKGLKHYRLKDVSKYLGVTLDNAHSALYDTIATAEVLIRLANQIV